MHGVIKDFAKRFEFTGTILEVGALDENGSLSQVLSISLRTDMRDGKGVDEVIDACDLLDRFGPEAWDNVVSAEMLEHAERWDDALRNMWGVLKPGGKLLLTMARESKGYHGYPADYWRFPMADFLRLFGNNEVLGSFDSHPSIGACVVKSGPLDLSIRPRLVEGAKRGD